MKAVKLFFPVLLLFSFTTIKAQKPHGKLVVMIVIDGLGGKLLEKYRPAFTDGFKRMFDEGFNYQNAWVDHAITVSHAGHVTLATGDYPKTHGIVDAAFYERQGDSLVFTDAFADSSFHIAGSSTSKSISEKKVLVPGLAEWIKSNDLSAKVLCVGTGNISSALYCFHPGENVFWYDIDLGKYVTSDYFLKNEPAWVKTFNQQTLPVFFHMSDEWKNIVPQQFLSLANKDGADFESYGGKHVFPYQIPARYKTANSYNSWFRFPPFCDNATLALAKQGIESLAMGQSGSTDYLSVVLSQVDNTNHGFGPSSLETFNVLMQNDLALGDFYRYLDEKVGKGNYVVGLSADHGFPEIPEQTLQKGQYAKRIKDTEIETVLTQVKRIEDSLQGAGKTEVEKNIKLFLIKQGFIADVYTTAQLNDHSISNDPFLELYKKSYRTDRVPRLPFFSLNSFQSEIGKAGMMVRLKENTMIDLDSDIHGSPYDYDRYVPLMFMGMGVKKGSSGMPVYTIDMAPTLAKLGSIPVTVHTDGKALIK